MAIARLLSKVADPVGVDPDPTVKKKKLIWALKPDPTLEKN